MGGIFFLGETRTGSVFMERDRLILADADTRAAVKAWFIGLFLKCGFTSHHFDGVDRTVFDASATPLTF
jgi:hypothetical protein